MGNTAFTLHIGKGSVYAPLTITAPSSSSDVFTAEYVDGSPNGTYPLSQKDTSLHELDSTGYWLLSRTAGSSSPTVTLHFGTRCGTTNPSTLAFAQWDATTGKWKDKGIGANTSTTLTHAGSISHSATATPLIISNLTHIQANAGSDTTIYYGDTIQIGSPAESGLAYAWSPTTGLSSASIARPFAHPTDTTTYILTVTHTSSGCLKRDTVRVNVLPPGATCGNAVEVGNRDTTFFQNFMFNNVWFKVSIPAYDELIVDAISLDSLADSIQISIYSACDNSLISLSNDSSEHYLPYQAFISHMPDSSLEHEVLVKISSLKSLNLIGVFNFGFTRSNCDVATTCSLVKNGQLIPNESFYQPYADGFDFTIINDILTFVPILKWNNNFRRHNVPCWYDITGTTDLIPYADAASNVTTNRFGRSVSRGVSPILNSGLEIPGTNLSITEGNYVLRIKAASNNNPVTGFRVCLTNNFNLILQQGGNTTNIMLNNFLLFNVIGGFAGHSYAFTSPNLATVGNWSQFSTCFKINETDAFNVRRLAVVANYNHSDPVQRELLFDDVEIFPLKVDLPEQITSPCRTATIATACPIPSINGDVRYYLYYVDELGAEELVSWNYTGSFQGVYPPVAVARYRMRIKYFSDQNTETCEQTCTEGGWDETIVRTQHLNAPPKPQIKGDGFACTSNPLFAFSNSAFFVNAGYNIQWQSTDANTAFTNANAASTTVSYLNPYSQEGQTNMNEQLISLTISDSSGCVFFDQMPVYQCCSIPVDYTGNVTKLGDALGFDGITNSLSLPAIVSNQNYLVNGEFNVFDDLNFSNCKIFMGPLARIVVKSSDLEITEGYLRNGCRVMWDKIDLEGQSTIKTDDCIIEDGIAAIYTTYSQSYHKDLKKTDFNKNYRSLFIDGYYTDYNDSTASSTIISQLIDESLFRCRSSVSVPAVNQCEVLQYPPYCGLRSFAGIEVRNVDGAIKLVGRDENKTLFDNLDFGIRDIHSWSVRITNFKFTNLSNRTDGPDYAVGYGIHSIHRVRKSLFVPAMPFRKLEVINCIAENSHAGFARFGSKNEFIFDNTLLNCWFPYRVESNLLKFIDIYRNTISGNFNQGTNAAIYIRNIHRSAISIALNTITGSNSFIGNTTNQTAIKIENPSWLAISKIEIGEDWTTSGNLNTISNVKRGIVLRNITPFTINLAYQNRIIGNQITLSGQIGGGTDARGISLENCTRMAVLNNQISRPSYSIATTVWNNQSGITLTQSPRSLVWSNAITSLGTGIRTFSNNFPSALLCNSISNYHTGMFFQNATQGNQYGGQAQRNTFAANQAAANRRLAGNLISPEKWWFNQNEPNELIILNFHTSVVSSGFETEDRPESNCLNMLFNRPPIVLPPYDTPNEYRHAMYYPLLSHQRSYSWEPALSKYLDMRDAYYCLMQEDSLLNTGQADDSLYVAFADSMAATNAGKLFSLISYAADSLKAEVILDSLAAFVPANDMEEAQQKVLTVYYTLQHDGRQWLTPSEFDSLSTLALSDEALLADAVFMARVLTGLEPEADTMQARLSDEQEQPYMAQATQVLQIFPNPTQGTLNLQYSLPPGSGTARLSLSDYMGRELQNLILSNESGLKTLQLAHLNSGLYLISLRGENGILFSGKFVLHK